MTLGMGRGAVVALVLASACGNNNGTETAGGAGTESSGSTTDSGGTSTSTSDSGGSQSDTAQPTTSGGSNSDSDSTTSATVTTTGSTETTGPGTDSTSQTSSTSLTSETTASTGETTETTGETTSGTTEGTTEGTTGETTGGTTMGISSTTDGTSSTGIGSTTEADTTTGEEPCGSVLKATIRDFMFSHPDFEDYGGNVAYKGLVEVDLGADKKPVYAHPGPTPQTSGPDAFKQWYNDTPGVNQTFMVDLPLTEVQPGLYQFADNTFFPIDGLGWGNEGQPNNFAFTTEIHTTFSYTGGEVFTFIGDDDVWVFINGKLALDLGGLHPQLQDSVDLDASAAFLGITPGQSYDMDIFHAERHTDESNFRIDTTIACFVPQ